MILIDPRDGAVKKGTTTPSDWLVSYIRRIGVTCDKSLLVYGDACFEGRGPSGDILVGIERKTLHDMLNCIDDARYNDQRIGMNSTYRVSFLILEGVWRAHDDDGILMQEFRPGEWGPVRYRSQLVMYSKLYRYLISVGLSGVKVIYSRDLFQTAFNICEVYRYFQKKWSDHTSLLETQKLNIPSLNHKPSLRRQWAACIDGVGVKFSGEAERVFRSARAIANSEERDWMVIDGIGPQRARRIIKQIGGM